jgi:hypothetical protein
MYYFQKSKANFISVGLSLPEKNEQGLVLNRVKIEKDFLRAIII